MTPDQAVDRWRTRYDCIEEAYVHEMQRRYPYRSKDNIRTEIRTRCEHFLKEKGFNYPIYPTDE